MPDTRVFDKSVVSISDVMIGRKAFYGSQTRPRAGRPGPLLERSLFPRMLSKAKAAASFELAKV